VERCSKKSRPTPAPKETAKETAMNEKEVRIVIQKLLDEQKSSKKLFDLYRFNTGWLATFSSAPGEIGGAALAVYDNGQFQRMPSASPLILIEILNEESQSSE
jgi:hypothetical protein